jgi:hypothetical protein
LGRPPRFVAEKARMGDRPKMFVGGTWVDSESGKVGHRRGERCVARVGCAVRIRPGQGNGARCRGARRSA